VGNIRVVRLLTAVQGGCYHCPAFLSVNRLSRKPLAGIKISSLSQLTDTKTNKGKTAMYYIIQQIDRTRPRLMNLPQEFPNVKKCTRVSFPTMTETMTKVRTSVVAGVSPLVRESYVCFS
jgi:hypothetical protein